MSLLKALLKATDSELASIAKDGVLGDISEYYDTGSYMLNAQISGSLFKGIPLTKPYV